MSTSQEQGHKAFYEAIAMKSSDDTKARIVDHARKVYPALPDFALTEWLHGSKVLGTDKDGRRWVLYGKWIYGGVYDFTTIIRETRRRKPLDWLINGQANKNCKNVWGSMDEAKTRIVFEGIEEKQREYLRLVH